MTGMKLKLLILSALAAAASAPSAKAPEKPPEPPIVYDLRQAAEGFVADNMERHDGEFVPLSPLPGGPWSLQYRRTLPESVRLLSPREGIAVLEFVQPPQREGGRALTVRLSFLLAPRAGGWSVTSYALESLAEAPGPFYGA